MPIISAAASLPLGQTSQSGTRLNGGDGVERTDAPAAAAAVLGAPTVPDEPATLAAGDATPARLAGDLDVVTPEPVAPAAPDALDAVGAADVAPAAAGAVV